MDKQEVNSKVNMGLNMRLARHFKRMSQLNLAELTGITQKTISRMEREKVILSCETAIESSPVRKCWVSEW